jgi:hypothetical protein
MCVLTVKRVTKKSISVGDPLRPFRSGLIRPAARRYSERGGLSNNTDLMVERVLY